MRLRSWVREGCGFGLVISAFSVLFYGVMELKAHDYVAALLLVVTGLSLLRAGVELLRPVVGE